MVTRSSGTRAWSLLLVAAVALAMAGKSVAQSADMGWPRLIEYPDGKITLYQPQLESLTEDWIEARAAVSVASDAGRGQVFGAVWIRARITVDYETRTVKPTAVEVPMATFPDVDSAKVEELKALLAAEIMSWDLTMSLDRLLAQAELVESGVEGDAGLKHDPPGIYYAQTPTVLVYIDGEPRLQDMEGSSLQYVVNTPYLLLYDKSRNGYYLKGGDWWYWSREVKGPWETVTDPPADVKEIGRKADLEAKKNLPADSATAAELEAAAREAAAIIVSTEPAEIIVVDGEPQWSSVEGTSILYLSNTESDVLMDIESQQYYILLAGRWYRSVSLSEGPWAFVHPSDLPGDFAAIPETSDVGDVLVSVSGTPQAQEALLENQIPKTAEVDRKTATVTVVYDGDPKFEPIDGTTMKYAANTDKSVLLIDGKYYCCEQAVWYMADQPKGPWSVCVEVPEKVQDIPASSPVYNVKHVYVYDSTPEVVYVAYTPAYMGSYVYGGCVVYGTGWYYRPWYGAYYYPRPVTYGFGVHYNPWTGWGFSVGVSYGWLHIGFHTGGYYGGYWGPAGYHHGYRHGYYHGYHHGYYHGARAGYRAGYRYAQATRPRPDLYRAQPAVRPTTPSRGGATTRPVTGTGRPTTPAQRPSTGVARPATPAQRPSAGSGQTPTQRPSTGGISLPSTMDRSAGAAQPRQQPTPANRPNNVYTDKNGNVYRNPGNGWERYDNNKGNWSNANRPSSGSQPQSFDRSRQDLQRQQDARQRGTQRSQSYSRPAQTPSRGGASPSRGSAGGRGGGGGGRRR